MHTVAVACDHAGLELKQLVLDTLEASGATPVDLGTSTGESVDYPDYGAKLARAVAAGEVDAGVVICGTGIGISIAANREPAVRAAVCSDTTAVRLARQHNDANVLALGARLVGREVAADCLRTFLDTPFDGGRHARRVAKLSDPAAHPTGAAHPTEGDNTR